MMMTKMTTGLEPDRLFFFCTEIKSRHFFAASRAGPCKGCDASFCGTGRQHDTVFLKSTSQTNGEEEGRVGEHGSHGFKLTEEAAQINTYIVLTGGMPS